MQTLVKLTFSSQSKGKTGPNRGNVDTIMGGIGYSVVQVWANNGQTLPLSGWIWANVGNFDHNLAKLALSGGGSEPKWVIHRTTGIC